LIQGREVVWKEGAVLLSPARTFHAFEIEGRGPWRIAWAFFDDPKGPPVIPGTSARLVSLDAEAFVNAVQALTREAAGAAEPAALQALVTLVDIHARRLAGVRAGDARLWRLWEEVEANLAHAWTVGELATRLAMSDEHLRRLCWREHQRSPMEHVLHLRMHRASTLLRTTQLKLDDLAQRVGFASVYSFSAAFKRWSGTPPSLFRQRPA
jgi:AraC-like DNA-binding protein